MPQYNHKKVEKKWQKVWENEKLYFANNVSKKPKYYQLETFPYPSAAGLHVGHPKGYIAEDIHARFMRMNGREVLYTMGWDAFGLPTENYAIKVNKTPHDVARANIKNFKRQIKMFGLSYDWKREINTSSPEYYRWTQWLFIQLFNAGLAYRKESTVNWCPKDQTVLANEQVIDGVCERDGESVIQKEMEQWFFKITDYTERLLNDLDGLDWPESTIKRQKDWIGKSEGVEIEFKINPPPAPSPRERDAPEGKFRYHTTDPKTWKALQERVLEMRKNSTKAEDVLWQSLRKNFIGSHFRRQHIVGKFIVDLVCLEKSLVIEVDGDIHDYQKKEDEERTKFLQHNGFRVIRFKNKEVLGNIAEVVEKIKKELSVLPFGEDLGGVIKVFTTRPDTIFGATYMVLAPEHALVEKLKLRIKNWNEVEVYIKAASKKTERERQQGEKSKTGVELKGIKAINPATKEEIPIWIADYVLAGYGTGAIMAVPAHDQRDFEFAKKFNLPIKMVVCPHYPAPTCPVLDEAYSGEGHLVDSGKFNGMKSNEAKKKITEYVGGKAKVQYKLHDWSISRQRYWGVPIPMVHCLKCGIIPVLEKDLPVKLPPLKNYRPKGVPPLASSEKFMNVACPKCAGNARRDPETLDTFVDSSWYFLRYTDPENKKKIFDSKKANHWMPIDLYVIGAEHTVLHLLYSRFITKFLYDQKYINVHEPFLKLKHVGLIQGEDGQKMSKSRGNVVNPDEIVERMGADVVRLYEMFMGPFDEGQPWDSRGIIGLKRFLDRVWLISQRYVDENRRRGRAPRPQVGVEISDFYLHDFGNLFNKTIKKVTEDIEGFRFNTAISALMILFNEFEKAITHPLKSPSLTVREGEIGESYFQIFLKFLAPFAPHMTEEIWRGVLGNKQSIHVEPWPTYDPQSIHEDTFELIVQINGKVRDKFEASIDISKEEAERAALDREKVASALLGKTPHKIIFVPKRLINLVV